MVLTCDLLPEVGTGHPGNCSHSLSARDTQLSSSPTPPCKLLSCFFQPPAAPPDPLRGVEEEDVPH